jgi:glycosyl transferase family 25
MNVDGIFVINVRSFVERRKNIEHQLDPLGLRYEFIHVYDADDLGSESVRKYLRGAKLSPGQLSCAMKHVHAFQLMAERNWQRALILEDDVIVAPDFLQGIQDALTESSGIQGPHVLFIGSGGNLYTPRSLRVSGKRLYQAAKGRLTEAYIIGRQAAAMRMEWIERNGIVLPADNLFDRIDRETGIVPYWLEEPVAVQGSKKGVFKSTLEPAPPNLVQRVKFELQKFRRKHFY